MYPSEAGVSRLGTGPRFGHEATDGQAAMVEQRDQDALPALAKDADQAQPSHLTLARKRWSGGHGRQRTNRDGVLGLSAHTEQPQSGHGYSQPQAGGALGIGHACALPLPAATF